MTTHTTRLQVPAPLSQQRPVDEAEGSRKALRCGRRWGKTRWAFKAAVVGHGPQGDWQKVIGRDEGRREISWSGPMHRGMAQGFDVVWLARDIPQSRTLWFEEIVPRFKNAGPGVKVNETEKRVEIGGAGKLWIRSAENVASVRGAGAALAGVIVDEAAWQDLEHSLREVILPALLDNEGWLILMSTTNAGKDGNPDLRTPSYFNIICSEIQAGERSDEWQEFTGTAFDNPVLSPAAIQELIDEYPPESVELAQEVYVKLLEGGAGLAFPEWDATVHTTDQKPERLSGEWRWSAAGDWGHSAPGWLGLFASSSEYSVCRWEFYYKETPPYQVGYTFGQRIKAFPRPEWVVLDSACWNVTDGGPTIAEQFQDGLNAACGKNAPPVISAPKGSGSRVTGKLLVHDALRYKRSDDGSVKQWDRPKLLVHTDCKNLVRTLPKLPRSERNPEDVDTTAEDHPYDGLRYWLMARTPRVEVEEVRTFDSDSHPGFTRDGVRVKPWAVDRDEWAPVQVGPRYSRNIHGNGDEGYEW